jgi:hypothetical protein
MSVTFFCPEAPSRVERVPCDSPDLGLECTEGARCGYCDDGWTEQHVSDSPEASFSNFNTRTVLAALQLPADVIGSLTPDQIPAVLRRCMLVLNRADNREPMVHDGYEEPRQTRVHINDDGLPEITTGPRVIHCAVSDASVICRLRGIQEILAYAAEHDYTVAWG